ncbi:MAG: DUF4149 domain-containing protein [Acidobacteriota bacterium]|nr:DUF4149 domain-containing protein [Acidobacteriota bacterium]
MTVQLHKVRILLLSLWIGAAIFFSAVVAPTAFRVLRAFNLPNAGEIAGAIVNQALGVVNTAGFIISLLLLASTFPLRRNYSRTRFVLQNILLGVIAISTGIGEWVIAAKMRALRAAMSLPIDRIDLSDPGRVAFQTLHGYSVAALSIAIIAALIAFFVIATPVRHVDE